MFASKDTLLTRPSGGYTIARSVRFRSSASAYLSRTFGTATNNLKWTWSAWVKRGTLGANVGLLGASTDAFSTNWFEFYFGTNDTLKFDQRASSTANVNATTTAVFRDPSAWYHIVFVYDSPNATANNRTTLYVNGVLQALTYSVGPFAQNTASQINGSGYVAGMSPSAVAYFDGYMTEINFIDGQALTPSSFGSTNAITGVWQPAKYTGTYGTNGFYLNFSDNSNNTATTIGKDYSGNGNNWTPNNISVTAGATYDSMTDVPTLTSATAANYCVLNPLDKGAGVVGAGNLSWQYTTAAQAGVRASMDMLGGNWYFEGTYTEGGTAFSSAIGIALSTWSLATYVGDTGSWSYHSNGNKYVNGTSSAYGATYTTGDVIGITFNSSTGTLTAYKNNSSQGTLVSGLSVTSYFAAVSSYNSSAWAINFGQRPFSYTPPTGYVALNTYNLPASTITNGAAYMAATTWTGVNTSAAITISNAVNGVSFQPDLVWGKPRSLAYSHSLSDSVRGANKRLQSQSTAAEDTNLTYGYTSSFNSDGFTTSAGATDNENWNTTGATFVAWQWKAGTTSASNTNGSITSTVSAGATQGFSVVTYTTPASGTFTVGHGLGVAPSFIINRIRTIANNWYCYHVSLGNNTEIVLNTTAAATSAAGDWNSTTPTSTVFSMGSGWAGSYSMVSYCFAAVAGYSAFGSYTGNGSADGPFVYTGFRPRWLLLKNTGGVASWYCLDSSRNTYNVVDAVLVPNSSQAEVAITSVDFLSNGFKLRTTTTDINGSGTTYIYACFAENPMKNSLAR